MTGTAARVRARLAGAMYVYIVVMGLSAEMLVRSGIYVSGDPAATASRLLAAESAYRWAAAGELLMWVFDVIISWLLYELLRPVSRTLAAVAALLRLVTVAVLAPNTLLHFAPLTLLSGRTGLDLEQAQGLTQFALSLHGTGYNISLVFFGVHCLVLGYLLARSGFFPRVIGWLVVAAGLGYLLNSFAGFVAPPVASMMYPWTMIPPFVAESALALWLLAVGVNPQEWEARAAAAARS